MGDSRAATSLVPKLELPKGGGAVRGLDEKLTANPATGSATLAIPLPATKARALTPELAITYDSGNGNGPFGIGFQLNLPAIARRTDKGVPRYLDSDIFILTGADDLVPYLDASGAPIDHTTGTLRVQRYRPRVERDFARIERHSGAGVDEWRMLTPDNVSHVFAARLVDPDDDTRVFRWSLTESFDDQGNRVRYTYDATAQYLEAIEYGNLKPNDSTAWLFAIQFVYDDARPDAWSSFRAGFEVRTSRLCRRVELTHRIPGMTPIVVRSVELDYDGDPALAHLLVARPFGHDANGRLPFPELALTWSTAEIDHEVRVVSDESIRNLPTGLADTIAWVDLGGEGLSGALLRTETAWHYKRNLGGGVFGPLRVLSEVPIPDLDPGYSFGDPEQRGQTALVSWTGPHAGYRYREGETWGPYSTFATPVTAEPSHTRMLDVDGDGFPDLVVTEDHALRIYPSLGAAGFDAARSVPYPTDEDGAEPTFVFGDLDQTIFLADMSGDGLVDVVRIRNSSVSYWPNLGHGRFGARRDMVDVPVFDTPDAFDPSRLRLADTDGSGTTDLVYLGARDVRLWRNLAGTRFGAATVLDAVPAIDRLSTVAVLDFEADGTGCLVWSSNRAVDGRNAIRYLRLTSGIKPHLVTTYTNGMGVTSTLTYEPSTRSYITDDLAGRPWATRLPFPVQVVTRIEHAEVFSGTRIVQRFAYHHGAWDPIEREFRGFGMVEQWDADEFAVAQRGDPVVVPPVHKKTWFHPGVMGNDRALDAVYRQEWASGLPVLAAPTLPPELDAENTRLAIRALAKTALREETFTDGAVPITVAHHRAAVRLVQPATATHPAVFAVSSLEDLICHAEGNTQDPRLEHAVVLEIDLYGNPLATAKVSYARAAAFREEDEQGVTHVAIERALIANVETDTWMRLGVPIETTSWATTSTAGWYAIESLQQLAAGDLVQLGATRVVYQRDIADDQPLPFQAIESKAIPFETYDLAYRTDMLGGVDITSAGYLEIEGAWWRRSGRAVLDRDQFFRATSAIDAFGTPTTITYDDTVTGMVAMSVADVLANVITIERFDYVHFVPLELVDPNRNHVEVALDARGVVIARAVKGKLVGDAWQGDTIEAPTESIAYDIATAPVSAHATLRTTHGGSAFEEIVSYFDGAGRPLVVMHSAPGDRWIASGRVVYDNKGQPVMQYEPYFTADATWNATAISDRVGSVTIRDALGRTVETRHADGSFTSVTFSPWHETHADENDNSASWEPAGTDALTTRGRDLARKHVDTPTIRRVDPRGLAIGVISDSGALSIGSRTTYDLAGREWIVENALRYAVRTRTYDLLGRPYLEVGVDDGERRGVLAGDDKPIWSRSARGYITTADYDKLRRAIATLVVDPDGRTFAAERHVFGESAPGAESSNLRTQPWTTRDGAGEVVIDHYNFDGHAELSSRQVWSDADAGRDIDVDDATLAGDVYATTTVFDALGRVVSQAISPDDRLEVRTYGRDGALASVTLDGANVVTSLIHDARGLRQSIVYGNGVTTTYTHDVNTLRLATLTTVRGSETLQELTYCYDAVGNVTSIYDASQAVIYNNNDVVYPRALYEYDGLSRLTRCEAREHSDQGGGSQLDVSADYAVFGDPNDGQRMRTYVEQYAYDAAGNFATFAHRFGAGFTGGWLRTYTYVAGTNQIASIDLDGPFGRDFHGNTTSMPGITNMDWDWHESMSACSRGTSYTYDAANQRVTKRWTGGAKSTLRIYLGGLEIYRDLASGEIRHSRHVMDDKRRIAIAERDVGAAPEPGLVRYQLDDHLGSCAIELAGDDGRTLSREEFHPYGTTSYQAQLSNLVNRPKRYRFTGMERDTETGLALHGVRYYAPWLGRWTSPDPDESSSVDCPFRYCSNSPVLRTDSAGMADVGPESVKNVWEALQIAANTASATKFPGKQPKGASPRGTFVHKIFQQIVESLGFNFKLPKKLTDGILTEAGSSRAGQIETHGAGPHETPSGGTSHDVSILKPGLSREDTKTFEASDVSSTADLKAAKAVESKKQKAYSRKWKTKNDIIRPGGSLRGQRGFIDAEFLVGWGMFMVNAAFTWLVYRDVRDGFRHSRREGLRRLFVNGAAASSSFVWGKAGYELGGPLAAFIAADLVVYGGLVGSVAASWVWDHSDIGDTLERAADFLGIDQSLLDRFGSPHRPRLLETGLRIDMKLLR